MGEFDALATEIYRSKIRRARLSSPAEKLRETFELSEAFFTHVKCDVLLRHPEASDAEQTKLVRQQLAELRDADERDLYRPYIPDSYSL